jgi:hypothetical protein
VSVAALPVDVAVALTELVERRGVESGDTDLRAPDDVVVEVFADEHRDVRGPIAGVDRIEGDAATPAGDLIGPDGKNRFKGNDTEALQR